MCGIVGIARFKAGELIEKDRDVFLQLLNAGVVRGHHGTGVFAIDKDGGIKTVKNAGPPYMLMVSPEFAGFWNQIIKDDTYILVGHNRYATTGKKITAHAHPFLKDHIVMVHNGTLESGTTIPKFKDFDVDSEALANSIATVGIEETIKNTVGAYAIIYWDLKNKTLNVIRNTDRPLHMCIDEFLGRIVIASEEEMLKWIAKRNFYDFQGIIYKEVPANVLLTFSFGDATPVETALLGKTRSYAYTGYSADYSNNMTWSPTEGKWIKHNQLALFVPNEEKQRAINEFFTSLEKEQEQRVAVPARTTRPPHKDPRLKEVFINTKDYIQSAELFNTDKSKSLKKGDKIAITIDDHIPEDAAKQLHVVIASNDDWPDCRFQFRVEQDGVLDAMFEAIVVEVTLMNFLEPRKHCVDKEVIVWANAPRIIMDTSTTVH